MNNVIPIVRNKYHNVIVFVHKNQSLYQHFPIKFLVNEDEKSTSKKKTTMIKNLQKSFLVLLGFVPD
jgi:hypothetical protein